MKVLAINGSPRKGGNTDILLDKALEGAAASGALVEKISLDSLDIAPCREIECGKTREDGLSIVEDDIYVVFEKIKGCDALIIGSSIFFGSITAQLKAMIDRFQCVWIAKNFQKKDIFNKRITSALICVEATDRTDFFDNAEFIVKQFFVTISAEYKEKLFCSNLEEKAAVLKKPKMLDKAYELGKKMAEQVRRGE